MDAHSGAAGWSQSLAHGGPHSDNETQLQAGQPIYSFSFGAERKFVVPLLDNTCVVMRGDMQRPYKHSVPRSAKVKERRPFGCAPVRLQ